MMLMTPSGIRSPCLPKILWSASSLLLPHTETAWLVADQCAVNCPRLGSALQLSIVQDGFTAYEEQSSAKSRAAKMRYAYMMCMQHS